MTRSILAVMIVLLVLASSAAGFLLIGKGPIKTVQFGSKFQADYIGKFEDGRVFDTTLYDVAMNNDSYPKSLTYQWTNNSSRFAPVNFTQGLGLIKGFSNGVMGMHEGEWKNFSVSPENGYSLQTSKLKSINISSTVQVSQRMTYSEFNNRYGLPSNYVPQLHLFLTDPIWGWRVSVTQAYPSNSTVVVTNEAESGAEYVAYAGPDSSYGWKVRVLSVEGGDISAQHLLTPDDVRHLKGYDSSTKTTYILNSVNLDADQAVLYSGKEVDGQELVFTVHVISIK